MSPAGNNGDANSTTLRFTIEAADAGARLDVFLSDRIDGVSRSHLKKLIASGAVTINGEPAAKAGAALVPGDEVAAQVADTPQPLMDAPEPQDIPLRVVYEDAQLLVIDKPAGMVVHPSPGHARGTLVNALLGRSGALADAGGERPGIVHRLDRHTSGLIVVARDLTTLEALQKQFSARSVRKLYLALVFGRPAEEQRLIDANLGRHPTDRKRQAITPGKGRAAQTGVRLLESGSGISLVAAAPHTGRTHQIRVHLASINLHVVGDPLYSPAKRRAALRNSDLVHAIKGLPGQALHAASLSFDHPKTGERLALRAAPEERFLRCCEAAGIAPPVDARLTEILGELEAGGIP